MSSSSLNLKNSRTLSAAELTQQRRVWDRMLVLSPEATATRILTGIERRAPRVLVGTDTVQAAWLQRLFPVGYWRFMAPALMRALKNTKG